MARISSGLLARVASTLLGMAPMVAVAKTSAPLGAPLEPSAMASNVAPIERAAFTAASAQNRGLLENDFSRHQDNATLV